MTYQHIWGQSKAADRIFSLVTGFSPERIAKRGFMVLRAYFDESEKRDAPNPTHVTAGFVASAENWTKLSEEWEVLLKVKNMKVYKWINMTRRDADSEEFFRLIEKYVDCCVYCITDIGGLHKAIEDFHFPYLPNPDLMKKRLRNPYFITMKYLMIMMAERREDLGLMETIDMIFDRRTEGGAAMQAYNFMLYSASPELRCRIGNINYMADDDVPALQAADLCAGWVRKAHMEGKDLMKVDPYPWSVKKGFMNFCIYQDYDFFMGELEGVLGPDNLNTFREYVELEESV